MQNIFDSTLKNCLVNLIFFEIAYFRSSCSAGRHTKYLNNIAFLQLLVISLDFNNYNTNPDININMINATEEEKSVTKMEDLVIEKYLDTVSILEVFEKIICSL